MTGLIVPVDVLAYCIGTLDAHGPARGFAGATTDYSNQVTSTRPAFLGINVTRDYAQPPLWPLEAGVHLHWAMPDALTRADTTSGDMRFPPLPDRWLVTRIAGTGASARHWIIESDTLSTRAPGGANAPTVPVAATPRSAEDSPASEFRYLGVTEVFTEAWQEPLTKGVSAIKAATGYELHAVATGDIAFAAFYPNARGVFGFHDDLDDLGGAPAELRYVVTGWYGAAANDPLHAGLSQTQLETTLGWTLAAPSSEVATYSLYSGIAQGIAWDPATRYLLDDPEPITGDVAIGNHPAEALAAYFRGVQAPTLPVFEELLTLYLTGLAPNLATPTAGQLAELDETLHELQFTGHDGGLIHTVTQGPSQVTDLPLPLADALNLLARLQQAADLADAQVTQGKWQLFASWYRLFQVDPGELTAAFNAFTAQYELQAGIAGAKAAADAALATQKTAVEAMLGPGQSLTETPATRYYTPNEPVVLLAGEAARPATRYGGDGAHHPAGYLVCRLDDDVLTGLTIAPSTKLTAARYAALAPPAPNHLPYPAIGALVEEAALLDPAIGAAASGQPEAALAADLEVWLAGGAATLYGSPIGAPPSPVEVQAWPGANPWCSMLLLWEADFHPLLDTTGSTAYPAGFFTDNYALDPDRPRMIAYAPDQQGIAIDPAAIDFDPRNPGSGTQRYQGAAVLSSTSADNLRAQLARYLATTPDPTLQAIADQLASTDILMQGMTGFNDALLTRQRSLQLAIGVSPTAHLPFRQATAQLQSVVTSLAEIPPLAPQFNGAYNGVRAGYFKLALQVVDPFGRKRPVQIDHLHVADSLTVHRGDTVEPGIIYAQPRLAQPSRLELRWLAADPTEYDEMNVHPATTPVCGWLSPNHLAVGFFLYNAQGNPLGSLALRDDGSGIVWQATPGNASTIDADLATVMQHENPHLRDVAVALGGATPTWFRAFWQATDRAVTQICPAAPASQSGLAALVGRPLALVQASLRLERHGIAAFDQAFTAAQGGAFVDTDHGVGDVQLPVVIGDLARLDDGLVGYWKPSGDGYATTTFYTQAAPGTDPGVVAPGTTNLLLTAAATPETAPTPSGAETRLLMLVDPRAAIHATMGVLPTQALVIPPDMYDDVLTGLELTYPATPVLRPAGGVSVPLPAIAGFNWSWIEEDAGPTWSVDPDITPPTAAALWQYSPQRITEGWLRINPELLLFRLANPAGAPTVTAGTTTTLTLTVTNARKVAVTFTPATLVGETVPRTGSIVYIHLGALVDATHIAALAPSAPGWTFAAFTDPQRGTYWAATPSSDPVTLAPGASLAITLANLAVATTTAAAARVYFDYYGVTGDDDGVDLAILAITQPAPSASPVQQPHTISASSP